jgi:hypothetical protein
VEQGKLLLLLGVHLCLTGLPGVAAALLAARRGVMRVPVLLALALAAIGAVGLLGFWAYFADRVVGEAFSYFVVFGSVGLSVRCLWGGNLDRCLLRRLGTPLALWALGSAFLVFLGFAHGGADAPLMTAGIRFSHGLPGDNGVPVLTAEWIFAHGHHGTPPEQGGDWLLSDRPPLQAGFALAQRPFGWDFALLNYQLLGVVLQQLWIVGLWALLLAARVGRVTRALTMATVLVSGLALLNGFFVWPKMLPAAMLLGAAALVATPVWLELRRNLWAGALVAALCALALLAHGASVFAIIPLTAVAAYRGLPSWRWLAVALGVGIALMAPWSAYQKWEDPPGNRLVKWTLAGVAEVDDRGVVETILDSYGEAGLDGALENKEQNFITMTNFNAVAGTLDESIGRDSLTEVVRTVRGIAFFYLLPSLGLLLLAPLAMAWQWRHRRRDPIAWSFALTCMAIFVIGIVGWGLISFGNIAARTVIHFGTYLLPLIGMVGCVAGLRAAFPRFALYYVGFSAILSLAIYAPALDPPPGSFYSPLAIALAALSLAGFVAVSLRGRRSRRLRQSQEEETRGRPFLV